MAESAASTTPLLHLLTAPSKQFVDQLCTSIFAARLEIAANRAKSRLQVDKIMEGLSLAESDALELRNTLLEFTSAIVSENACTPDAARQVLASAPFSLEHAALQNLLAAIACNHAAEWREAAIASCVSMPRLVDLDWRVDIRSASQLMARMSAPVLLMDLAIQKPAEKVGQLPETSRVNFELSRETLDVILEGLGKIKDQLSGISTQ